MGGATRARRALRSFEGAVLALGLAACAAPAGPPSAESAPQRLALDPVAQQIAAIPDVTVEATAGGAVVVTFPSDLLFPDGRALLTGDGAERLSALVQCVAGYPEPVLRVLGHSDLDGSESVNLGLSEDRAEGVREFLVEHGISPARVGAAGFGAEFPVATNDTEEGRTRNRRLEIEIQPDATTRATRTPGDGR